MENCDNNLEHKRYSLNALFLVFSTVIVKGISVLYKIPLTALIGATGRGIFGIAYNLYMPIFALCVGGFPIAVSKIISAELARNNFSKIKEIKKASFRLFFLAGLIGSLIIVVLAKPYAELIAGEKNAVYAIYAVAPSVLFSCLASAKRGYFEGFSNMIPTSVSQIIDSVFKMVFGILFARFSMSYFFSLYQSGGYYIFNSCSTDAEALSVIYPITAAASMLGITIGTFASWLYLEIYSAIKNTKMAYGLKYKGESVTKEIVFVAMPIMVAGIVQSVSNFLDTATIQNCISNIDTSILWNKYSESLELSKTLKEDTSTYVYGIYNTVLDFKNIAPMLTGAVGVAAVPALSSAYVLGNKEKFTNIIETLIKYSIIIGGGIGFAVSALPRELIYFLYGENSTDMVVASENLMRGFGFIMVIIALCSPVIYSVQAIGMAKKSIASFIVAGLVKILLNYALIMDIKFELMGSVISNFVSFLIILIWNILILFKYTKIKIAVKENIVYPLLASVSIYFSTDYLKLRLNFQEDNRYQSIILFIIIVIYYIICLFSLGILNKNTFKFLQNSKILNKRLKKRKE